MFHVIIRHLFRPAGIVILLSALCCTPGCRKNRQYDLPVRGNVENICTDKGFPNVLVQLSYDKQIFSQYTDANGDFDFGRVPLDSKKKDGFRLGLPRVETDSFELHGVIVTLYDDDIGVFHQFSTLASFNVLHIVMSQSYTASADDSTKWFFLKKSLKKRPGKHYGSAFYRTDPHYQV